ncbi:MAG: hypothetical protein ACXVBE_16330, partial [Bdellovibrionota bacterium]
ASIFDLESLYSDMFFPHQLPLLETAVKAEEKSGLLSQVLKTQANNLKKDVSAAARPVMKNGEAGSVRNLRVEEVLSPVDIFRGCFGKDCSILSVPYFPAVKGTKTYFVHKSKVSGAPPDGYVFVAPVKLDGKILPYVITANGNLTAEDVQKAVQAVALDWGADEYVRVNFTNAPNVVNSEAMREGLRATGGKAVRVELPPGWEEVSKFVTTNGTGYKNYYAASSLQDAFVTKVKVETPDLLAPIKRTLVESKPLHASGKIHMRPAFDRALLAAGAVNGEKNPELREFVMKRLEVSPTQLAAAEKLQGNESAIGKELYAVLEKEFGFRFRDLETLDLAKWMNSLNRLQKEAPSIASEAEWSKSYERVFADISKDWGQTPEQDRVRLLEALRGFTKDVPASHRQAGKAFIDGVVAWMISAERFPHRNFIDLMGQSYIDAEMFKRAFSRIAASANQMDQASLDHFTGKLVEYSPSWSKAEQKTAWQSWYKGVDPGRNFSKTLYQVPDEFRDIEWMEAIWSHGEFGSGSRAFLSFKRELPSRAPLTAPEREVMNRMEEKIISLTDKYLTKELNYGDSHGLVSVLEVLNHPEYNAHFLARYGREGLRDRIFELMRSDRYGSWPRFDKFQSLQKLGFLEEYLKIDGLGGAWWKGAPEYTFAKGMTQMLKDPMVPESTKSALRHDILKDAEQRYEKLISKQSYDSAAYFFSVDDLKNPYLLDLLGSARYEKLIEQLRRDFLENRFSLWRNDRSVLEGLLRTIVRDGPAEAAVPTFAMLDEAGWVPAADALHADFAARMKKDPAMALQYRHVIEPGLGKSFSRGLDSCRRFFAGFNQ